MTAINIVVAPKIITIATDGAAYDPNGIVTAIGSKVYAVPHLNCVFASRGTANALSTIADSATECYVTFDDMLADYDANFEDVARDYRGIEVLVAGFTRAGPVARYIRNEGLPDHPGYPKPYTSVRTPNVFSGPLLPDDIAASIRIRAFDSQDRIVQQLRRTVAAQRRWVGEYGWHSVGAFCQITTVTTEGIEMCITDRWPEDRIGEFIRPEEDNQ